MNWYCLTCSEELFTVQMLREANYEAWTPFEVLERKLGRKVKRIERALFPGYVFVFCTDLAFRAVQAIGGAEDFVRFTNLAGERVPLRMPENALVPAVLAQLYGDFDHTKTPPPWEPKRGDPVRVKAGKMRGYLGAILSIGKSKTIIKTEWCNLTIPTSDLELAA